MASPASSKNNSPATLVGESSPHKAQKTGVVFFFDKVNDDALHVILPLLPAKSYAAAACVCRSWSRTASVTLSKPKLVSAMSILPTIPDAADDVVDKVLSENIRPGSGIGETRFHVPLRRCVTAESVTGLGDKSIVAAKSEDGKIAEGERMIHLLATHSVFKNLYIGVEKMTKDESRDSDGTLALSLHQAEM